jgi:putative oxidoreductase
MDAGLLIARAVVGLLFVGHGTQKLFGWFDGHGPEGTGGFLESVGYKPGKRMAVVTGICEAGAGALLILGLFTPLAAAVIIGVMLNATLAVHAEKGVWNDRGGFELPLVYATIAAALAFVGPGSASIDEAIGPFSGYFYGFVAIALGIIAGFIAHSMREEEVAEEEQTEEQSRAA